MTNSKKLYCTLACGVLAVALGVTGSFAYLTAQKSVDNVFTIGEGLGSKIVLDEPNWNPDDAKNLLPNATVKKDPTVKNNSTVNVYAFIEADVPVITTGGKETALFTFKPNSGWVQVSTTTKDNVQKTVYAYASDSAMTVLAPTKSATLFNTVTVCDFEDGNAVQGSTQTLTAKTYVIQADDLGKTTPADVWSLVQSELSLS
jgi:predicted ribosomally synthesized peptide with SipW-like signal peptide